MKKHKKTKRKPKPRKAIFVMPWGSYPNETLVVVGLTHSEVMEKLKVGGKPPYIGVTKKFYDWVKGCEKYFVQNAEREDKGFLFQDGGASVLWLKEWDGSWSAAEVLIHELHHAVHFILGQGKIMGDEVEALAYQQEYLFRGIRQRLNKE